LSPENQPSRRPPDLTALVLILFYDGGVESITPECEKSENQRKMRCSKRYVNGLFFCRNTVAEGFIAKQKSSLIL